jgi:hypothetical protein
MQTDSTPQALRFMTEYWAWMQRQRTTEPTADEFGLHPVHAEALARKVHYEHESKVVAATRAREN